MSMVDPEPSVTSIVGDCLPSTGSNNVRSNHPHRQRSESMAGSSRFKGVSCQNNGHWGAQIYVNQQRIWLGTFKSEKEAAMAYDSAAIKLRNGDSHRNFPWTSATVQEPHFQRQFDVEAILVMIKDGSYMNKFSQYLKAQLQVGGVLPDANPEVGVMGQELFQKELTPSDVGKLNRLVIPRKFAVKYFPSICTNAQEQDGEVIPGVQDTDIFFHDRSRRSWKFRYCYWKSSQSFVFTRGWNRFVKKERGLKAKDVVVFSCLEKKYMIDVRYNEAVNDASGLEMETKKVMDSSYSIEVLGSLTEQDTQMGEVREDNICGKTVDYFANETIINKPKGLRLFGVQIV